MDANKKILLDDLYYKVKRTCGNCAYSTVLPNNIWGTCAKYLYLHNKHEGGTKTKERQLSISVYGSCDAHAFSQTFKDQASHFEEFFE